jgi:hypothetical protein
VYIRIGAKAATIELADEMIAGYVRQMSGILGDHIFGYDQDTLSDVVGSLLIQSRDPLIIEVEGFSGKFENILATRLPEWIHVLPPQPSSSAMDNVKAHLLFSGKFDIHPAELTLKVSSEQFNHEIIRKYAGPPENGIVWGINTSLDFIRRYLLGILKN